MNLYTVYILKSKLYNRYYIGCTSNVNKRIKCHNSGKNKSTKPYKPWDLIYNETFKDKKTAFKREWYLKHPKGYIEKLNIIKKYGEVA